MDSRTNPFAPNLVGDDSNDEEIAGENEPLKMAEGQSEPPPGAVDYAFPGTAPIENPLGDPGLAAGSRDPDTPHSTENEGRPEDRDGGTPYDAEGQSGM